MSVKPIPDGYHTVTPYLLVPPGSKIVEFLVQAFGAKVVRVMKAPDGVIQHAQVRVGDSVVMMGEARGPHEPQTAMLYLYLPDVDGAYKRAMAAPGATSILEPMDMFYGDRSGAVKDAHGNQWWLATHIEDVPDDELARRAAAQGKG